VSESQSKKTVAATFSIVNEKGNKETAHGQLVISEGTPNYVIELFADFASEQPSIEEFFTGGGEVERYPLLHATTEDGSFTFVDSRLRGYKRNIGGGKLSRRSYSPYLVLKTELVLRSDELSLTHATFRLWGQDLWAHWINWSFKEEPGPNTDLEVIRLKIPPRKANYQGVDITIRDASPSLFNPGTTGSVTLRQTSVFKLNFPKPIDLKEFISEWVSPISFLVASGIRSAAGVETMWIGNSTWTDDETGDPIKRDIQVMINNPERRVPAEELDEQKFLHSCPRFDFPSQLPVFLEAWQKHRVTFEQYLDWIHRKPNSKLTQMSYMAQLVETFDRSLSPDPEVGDALKLLADTAETLFKDQPGLDKLSGKAKQAVLDSTRPTLSHRLKRLDGETGELVSSVLKTHSWKGDVPIVRNSLVHGLPTSKFFAKNHIPLYVSVDILELLFEARFLVALGFTPVEVRKMITEDDPRWFPRLSAILDYLDSLKEFRTFVPAAEVDAESTSGDTPTTDE
jgi:hypothetical protein